MDIYLGFMVETLLQLYKILLKYRKISVKELSSLTGFSGDRVKQLLESVLEYVKIGGELIEVTNPLGLALTLIEKGVDVKEVSNYLDWKDFEKFSAEILLQNGYVVKTNFKITKPVRFEVDVLGVEPATGLGLLIDCKHWVRGVSLKSLIEIMDKHLDRTVKFIKYINWFRRNWVYIAKLKSIVPIVVTLTTPTLRMHKGVLAVSIQELNTVLRDIYVVLDIFGVKPIKIGLR